MKWLRKIIAWLNQESKDEIDLVDWVEHNPKLQKLNKKTKYRQTEHGFIEVLEHDKNSDK
jgi:hypothetical protein